MTANKFSLPLVFLAFIIILSQTQFTPWPEMLLWPYLINHGWLAYRDIAIAHSPLLPYLLAGYYKFFGESLLSLKIFSWILVLFSALLTYFIAKKLFGKNPALAAFLLFLVLQYRYEGNGVWFDVLLAPLFLLVYFSLKEKKYVWFGFFWALAFFVKQTAVWLLIPVLFTFISRKFPVPKLFTAFLGALPVLLVILFFLIISRDIPYYFFWSIQFGLFILPRMPPQYPSLSQFVSGSWPFLIAFFIPLIKSSPRRQISLELLFFGFFSAFGVIPRWELFHFQPALPFLSLLVVQILQHASWVGRYSKLALGIFVTVFAVIFIFHTKNILFRPDRFSEPEVSQAEIYTLAHTLPGDTIFILNWWDSLYAQTGRLPPKPWVPQLPQYLSLPGMQEALIAGLSSHPPKLILFKLYDSGSYIPKKLDAYIFSHYTEVIFIGNQYEVLAPIRNE